MKKHRLYIKIVVLCLTTNLPLFAQRNSPDERLKKYIEDTNKAMHELCALPSDSLEITVKSFIFKDCEFEGTDDYEGMKREIWTKDFGTKKHIFTKKRMVISSMMMTIIVKTAFVTQIVVELLQLMSI